MRLNLGCGRHRLHGYVNIDAAPGACVDVVARVPPLRQSDASVDEIYCGHVLEHLDEPEGRALLAECFRVLRPGGRLGVVVPDTRAIARTYVREADAEDRGDGDVTCVDQRWYAGDLDDVCAFWLFSTFQDSPHRWAYDARTLRRRLDGAGFVGIAPIDVAHDARLARPDWWQIGYDAYKPEGVEAMHA